MFSFRFKKVDIDLVCTRLTDLYYWSTLCYTKESNHLNFLRILNISFTQLSPSHSDMFLSVTATL